MSTALVVRTAVGDFAPTQEMREAYLSARLTKRRQLDMRTKAGKKAWRLFKQFEAEKLAAWKRGEGYF